MSESAPARHVTHTLENGIHEFVIHEFSRIGTDEFVAAIVAMNHSADAGLPVLVDSSGGTMPIGYVIGRFRALYPNNPKPQQPFKIAVLAQPTVITGMIGGMLRAFSYMRVRLFREYEREAALRWLIEK